jgi:creatinine amidohydrolase/Fe(II)-dependent formamide hydrolase-like protein
MLHLAPALVRLERAAIGPQPPLADLVAHGVRALSPTGVLGDPSGATAEAGRQLFDELAHQLVGAVAAAISEWG